MAITQSVKKYKRKKISAIQKKEGVLKNSRKNPGESNELPAQCSQLKTTAYVVDTHHVACISLKKINELLDSEVAEVCPGVFVAPLFRGSWGAFAQIQIEPGMSHGPYLNTAKFMVGRVAAALEDPDHRDGSLEISVDKALPCPLHQDGYFQIPFNTIYTLHNKSDIHPVVISLQLFNDTSNSKGSTDISC